MLPPHPALPDGYDSFKHDFCCIQISFQRLCNDDVRDAFDILFHQFLGQHRHAMPGTWPSSRIALPKFAVRPCVRCSRRPYPSTGLPPPRLVDPAWLCPPVERQHSRRAKRPLCGQRPTATFISGVMPQPVEVDSILVAAGDRQPQPGLIVSRPLVASPRVRGPNTNEPISCIVPQ
jgi:hypothetical protein